MTDTDRAGGLSRVLPLLRFAVAYELALWRSLFRWIFRRPVSTEPGARAFGYTTLMMPVLIAFIVVSAIELPILHLLLPWETVRLIADLIGIYGLIWMFGLLASVRTTPHLVGGASLRIRNGSAVDIAVPWTAIATIRKQGRDLPGKTVQFERTESEVIMQVGVMRQTNIDLVLRHPIAVPQSPAEPITELRFYVDDPAELMTAVRGQLNEPPQAADGAGSAGVAGRR